MKIARVFPRRTSATPDDDLVIIGRPGLFRPELDEVHISCVFTWDIAECERLCVAWEHYYPGKVRIGGPAYNDPGAEFVPGRYVRKGITFTSRGCIRHCPRCLVPEREGLLRLLPIQPGNLVNDNNLLACPRAHIEAVCEMLKTQRRIEFIGGLDARLLKLWHVEAFKALTVASFWFACDSPKALEPLATVADLMRGYHRNKLRCYVMVAADGETMEEADIRLRAVWNLGFLPFAMFYRGEGEQQKTHQWCQFLKLWTRPAGTKALMRESR